ncbi:MAG: CHASE2 domain-containing protein [Burkholderiales bacterium]
MKSLFISYRREDAGSASGRLAGWLAREFGDENIFIDVDKIAPGAQFARVIEEKLSSCDCFLAIMGKTWASCTDSQGRRRLDSPDDFVRREIAAALRRDKLAKYPILVDGAAMPKAEELPEDIRGITQLNAFEIRNARYFDDAGLLIERLAGAEQRSLWEILSRVRGGRAARYWAAAIGVVVFLLAFVKAFDFFALDTRAASFTMWLGERFAPVAIHPEIRMVAINEETEKAFSKEFGKSWRSDHARLLNSLSTAQAKVVAFDIEFEEPSEFDPEWIASLKQAAALGTAVVLGRSRANPAPNAIERAAESVGIACIGTRLSYASMAPLAVKRDGRNMGSFPIHAAYPGLQVRNMDVEHLQLSLDDAARPESEFVRFPLVQHIAKAQAACPAIQKNDAVAQLMIKLSPLNKLREEGFRYGYEQLIVSDAASLSRDFAGKTVLVGVQKTGQDIATVRGGEERWGVELHADAVNNLMSGIRVRPLPEGMQFVLVATMSAVGAWLRFWRPSLAPQWRGLLALAVIAVYFALVIYIYQEDHLLLNVVYDLTAFALSYWMVSRLSRRWSR